MMKTLGTIIGYFQLFSLISEDALTKSHDQCITCILVWTIKVYAYMSQLVTLKTKSNI